LTTLVPKGTGENPVWGLLRIHRGTRSSRDSRSGGDEDGYQDEVPHHQAVEFDEGEIGLHQGEVERSEERPSVHEGPLREGIGLRKRHQAEGRDPAPEHRSLYREVDPREERRPLEIWKRHQAEGGEPAAAAAAAGVAGGLLLKGRDRRRKVLGVPVPDLDVQGVLKSVGKASKHLGQTSKSVSKDIERLGDEAERVGKILS